jgi:hypothetical protein
MDAMTKLKRNGTRKKIALSRMAAPPMTTPRVFFITAPPLG